jgi:hypothetical protein
MFNLSRLSFTAWPLTYVDFMADCAEVHAEVLITATQSGSTSSTGLR